MRIPVFGGFFLIAVIVLTVHVSAYTFTDDMAFAQSTAETQYSGLKLYSGNTYGISDPTTLTFSSIASPLGYALYRVNGAEKVTVGIYTFSGTCVSQQEMGLTLGQGGTQAYWSRTENSVYSDFGGGVWRLGIDHQTSLVFSPVNTPMPRDIKGFGLNIYTSADFDSPLPMSVTKSFSDAEAFYYEEYTAAIPPGAQHIKIEINDVTSYIMPSGEIYQITRPVRYTRLAMVLISGESLVMGEYMPVEQPPSSVAQAPVYNHKAGKDEDESIEAAASSEPPKDLPKVAEFEGAADVSNEKSSSSKFEGTITSSSKPEKRAQPKAAPQSEASSEKSRSSESVSESVPPVRDVVYEIRREKSGGLLTSGVTVYIIVVTGSLVLMLILGRKQ